MTTERPIEIQCRLFARYAEVVGTDRATLHLPPTATVADAVRELRERLPGGRALPERPLVAVNQAHARSTQPLTDGDELALLPPLAGG
ncbi:MAG TPA: MoaD/ThiS family protein [Gemmatimonadales bacterium]|nr:MoaD/ThiS family protein [Gemmatimonadales bacterium]